MSDAEMFPEHELLQQVADGDQNAFRRLFNKYHNHLGTYIYHLTGSMELAEEIVQDVFMKIWMSRETLAGVKSFKAYLFVISKNHALNCMRKLIKERSHHAVWDDETINQVSASDDEGYEKYYGLLDEAINHLPPQQQKVYLMSRHQHLKYAEIAQQLNISRESVKKYLQIAVASITSYVLARTDALALFFVLACLRY